MTRIILLLINGQSMANPVVDPGKIHAEIDNERAKRVESVIYEWIIKYQKIFRSTYWKRTFIDLITRDRYRKTVISIIKTQTGDYCQKIENLVSIEFQYTDTIQIH